MITRPMSGGRARRRLVSDVADWTIGWFAVGFSPTHAELEQMSPSWLWPLPLSLTSQPVPLSSMLQPAPPEPTHVTWTES